MQGSGPRGSRGDDLVHKRGCILKRPGITGAASERLGTGEKPPTDAQKPLQILRFPADHSNHVTLTEGSPRIR
jgi:hypothetical protein